MRWKLLSCASAVQKAYPTQDASSLRATLVLGARLRVIRNGVSGDPR